MNNINKVRIFGFYTSFSAILHILSYNNIIGSTRPLALFVLVCYIILFWVYPGYYFKYWDKGLLLIIGLLIIDIVAHFLPFYLLSKKDKQLEKKREKIKYAWKEIIIMTIFYLVIMGSKVFNIYSDPLKYLTSYN